MARQAVFLTDGGAYNDQGLAVSVSARFEAIEPLPCPPCEDRWEGGFYE